MICSTWIAICNMTDVLVTLHDTHARTHGHEIGTYHIEVRGDTIHELEVQRFGPPNQSFV